MYLLICYLTVAQICESKEVGEEIRGKKKVNAF